MLIWVTVQLSYSSYVIMSFIKVLLTWTSYICITENPYTPQKKSAMAISETFLPSWDHIVSACWMELYKIVRIEKIEKNRILKCVSMIRKRGKCWENNYLALRSPLVLHFGLLTTRNRLFSLIDCILKECYDVILDFTKPCF